MNNFSEVHTAKKASPHQRPCFSTNQNFENSFLKGHTKNNLVKLFQILTSSFGEEDFLRISSCPYRAKSLPPWWPCFSVDQNSAKNFREGSLKEQSCEIILISDQRFQRTRILKKSTERKSPPSPFPPPPPPPHGGHVFRRIKILQTVIEKGHTTNNLVKLFQILTSGFREEDFLRISSCPYSANSLFPPPPPPPPMAAMFLDGSKFREHFFKESPKEHSSKIISKSEQGFRRTRFFFSRISSCPYSAKRLPSPPAPSGHVFRRIQNS